MSLNPEKKKIILIGPAFPYRGGNSLFVMHTYEALKNYFDVKVYNYKLLYPSILFPGTTQYDLSSQSIKVPNKRIINSINPFNWFKTANLLNEENADLIVFDWWHPFFGFCHGVITFLIRKKYKNKILFITENVVSHEANTVDKILTRIGLKFASKFLVLSGVVEKDIKEFSKQKKVYRSELPVYDYYKTLEAHDLIKSKSDLGYREDSIVMLFFGYVRKYKGLDILINAFPDILKKYSNSYLLIVGEFYDDPDDYISIINKLGITDRVKVINRFVLNEEVAKFYNICDVVVLPYRTATQSGILNVAYGFNKPVVATNVGGLAEFIEEGKTGFLVSPDSPESIAEGITKFINSKSTIDFAANIEKLNNQNKFNSLPEVFKGILSDS